MNKILNFFTLMGLTLFSPLANAIDYENSNFKKISIDSLDDYAVTLISQEKGISTYSGLKNGLRLNYEMEDNQINKIVLVFDYDKNNTEKMVYIKDVINISSRLMPQKINTIEDSEQKLYKKLNSLQMKEDLDFIKIEQLKFECMVNNGNINIRITK